MVGISALGRGTPVAGRAGLVTASLAMDDLIASTGVAYRALANPSFMDNALRQVPQIRDQGVFTNTLSPDRKAPDHRHQGYRCGRRPLLLDRSWTGFETVPVLGPEDLSHDDMARIMSEVLGLPVRYQRQSLDDLAARLKGYGMGSSLRARHGRHDASERRRSRQRRRPHARDGQPNEFPAVVRRGSCARHPRLSNGPTILGVTKAEVCQTSQTAKQSDSQTAKQVRQPNKSDSDPGVTKPVCQTSQTAKQVRQPTSQTPTAKKRRVLSQRRGGWTAPNAGTEPPGGKTSTRFRFISCRGAEWIAVRAAIHSG